MFVCLCNGYTDTQIREAAAGCAGAVDCVYEHLGAAPRCRGCVEMAGEIIADYRQPLHAFVPARHPLACGTPVSLKQLLNYDHVLPDGRFGISQLLMRAAKREKARVAPRMVSNQLNFLRKLAHMNNCVVFMPVQAAYSELLSKELVPVNLDCKAFTNRNLSVAYRKRRSLSPATLSFSSCAQEQFRKWQQLDQQALDRAQSAWTV